MLNEEEGSESEGDIVQPKKRHLIVLSSDEEEIY